jgi:phage host-nuclease inhibitor protein Gam
MREELMMVDEQLLTQDISIAEIEEESEGFIINSDNLAEWALKKIKAETEEAKRITKVCQDQVAFYAQREDQIKKQLGQKTAFLKRKLADYFETVPHKKTKFQEKYVLPSGDLIRKKQSLKFNIDQNEAVLSVVQVTGTNEYVRQKLELDWETLKKDVEVPDVFITDKEGNYIEDAFLDEDGRICKISNPAEVIPGAYAEREVVVHKELKKVIDGIIAIPQPDKFEVKF